MTTKKELEAELADLRLELEQARKRLEEADDGATSKGKSGDGRSGGPLDQILSQFDTVDIDGLLGDFVQELESLQEDKPLLTLFGAFLLGYLLGRTR